MSYILDALRRADAERSRGAVPGLHAQGLPADLEPAARDYRPLFWAAGGPTSLDNGALVCETHHTQCTNTAGPSASATGCPGSPHPPGSTPPAPHDYTAASKTDNSKNHK